MRNEGSSVALQDHSSILIGLDHPHKGLRPVPRRKVIKLKPLQEDTRSPVQACKTHHLAVRVDTDCVSTSPLSFSPTSVLPQQREQGAGNLFIALKLQADNAAASAASLRSVKQQQLGSWAENQVIHNLPSHPPARPLPGAFEPETSGPIVISHQTKPQQPQAPVVNTGNTLDAAWHWRFKRLWRKEQLNYHIPQRRYGEEEEEEGSDPWHDALHMIQAANTSPAAGVPICDHDCYAESSPSPLLDSDDLDALLDAPVDKAAAGGPEMMRSSSSRALAEAASKARELLEYQAKLQQRQQSAFVSSWLDQQPLALKTRHPF